MGGTGQQGHDVYIYTKLVRSVSIYIHEHILIYFCWHIIQEHSWEGQGTKDVMYICIYVYLHAHILVNNRNIIHTNIHMFVYADLLVTSTDGRNWTGVTWCVNTYTFIYIRWRISQQHRWEGQGSRDLTKCNTSWLQSWLILRRVFLRLPLGPAIW